MDPLQKYLIDSLINPTFNRHVNNEQNFSGRSYGNGGSGGRHNKNTPYRGMERRRGGNNRHAEANKLLPNYMGRGGDQPNERRDDVRGKPILGRKMNGTGDKQLQSGETQRKHGGDRGGGAGSLATKGKPILGRKTNGSGDKQRQNGETHRKYGGDRGGGSVAEKRKQRFEIFKLKKRVEKQQRIIQHQQQQSESLRQQQSSQNNSTGLQQLLLTNPATATEPLIPVPVPTGIPVLNVPVATTSTLFVPADIAPTSTAIAPTEVPYAMES